MKNPNALWQIVQQRNSEPAEAFVYAVRTTGVYCRPGCPAKLPLRRNVQFYETPAAAIAAGFRPCKRCRPDAATESSSLATLVTQACRMIEQAEETPSLAELSKRLGLSQFHLQRQFKVFTGMTPKAYAAAQRAQRLRQELAASPSVTAAGYRAGYQSSSRLHAAAGEHLGMTPQQYRAQGRGLKIRYTTSGCTLGTVLVAATDRGICAILLGNSFADVFTDLQSRFSRAELLPWETEFQATLAAVVCLVEDPRHQQTLPLDLQGTLFQQRVWQALTKIPPGTTTTYSELAQRLGKPSAVRAVASACAKNPIGIAVPCHRVLRATGDLAGYRWGLDRKKELLRREQEKFS